jgi:hypothetical protein
MNVQANSFFLKLAARLAGVVVLLMAGTIPARATLGEIEASVFADQSQINATLRTLSSEKYTMHELRGPSGTTVREYVGSGGTVFAIAWDGPLMPNLRQLLGPQFDRYVAALAARRNVRGPVSIQFGLCSPAGACAPRRKGMFPKFAARHPRAMSMGRGRIDCVPASRWQCCDARGLRGRRRRWQWLVAGDAGTKYAANHGGWRPDGVPDLVFTTVTICAPGSTTNCQTIDHVQVDTGSVGLRIISSVLASGLALPQQQDAVAIRWSSARSSRTASVRGR